HAVVAPRLHADDRQRLRTPHTPRRREGPPSAGPSLRPGALSSRVAALRGLVRGSRERGVASRRARVRDVLGRKVLAMREESGPQLSDGAALSRFGGRTRWLKTGSRHCSSRSVIAGESSTTNHNGPAEAGPCG